MKIDNQQLAGIIEKCFGYAMDGGVKDVDQKKFSAMGKRLRGNLLNLITAEFEASTTQFQEASKELTKVNVILQNDAAVLSNVANTLDQLNKLASILDELLEIASSFH
jgi:hypothetical protein